MLDKEYRSFGVQEIRADEADGKLRIVGHAAVFGKESVIMGGPGGLVETIQRGAFTETIEKDDIFALMNHNSDFVLGRKNAGTLALKEDRQGLAVEIFPPDVQWVRDYMVTIGRGDISQMSIGFSIKSPQDEEMSFKGSVRRRNILKIALMDVSPTPFAAYPDTDVALRSFDAWQKAHPPDKWLEDAERDQRLAESEAPSKI